MSAYEWEREEWRDALDETAECHSHNYSPNTRGGGTCRDCGDEISADEL